MQDFWYADNKDLMKWGVLLRLAETYKAKCILQLAFNPRDKGFPPRSLVIDGDKYDIPEEVVSHLRNMHTIGGVSRKVRVTVFDPTFKEGERESHCRAARRLLEAFSQERCIVFLDPDTGLEPPNTRPKLVHVLRSEALTVWDAMKDGDVFGLFQHGQPGAAGMWFEAKWRELAEALGMPTERVKTANGPLIAPNVVIFYVQKLKPTVKGGANTQATVASLVRPSKPKSKRQQKPCADGCGNMVASKFRPGHDAKYKSMVLKVERGEMKIEELPAPMREQLKWATTENGLRCLNPITKLHK
jgi:hypothetical protein